MAPLLSLLLLSLTALTSAWKDPTPDTLSRLPNPSDSDFNIHTGALLSPLLIPRVPGTPGSLKALTHLQDFFRTQLPLWTLSTQNSTSTTPTSGGKQVPFVNLYATRDPPGVGPGDVGRLVLVAHYDSRLMPRGFIGATDSAVPCAVMMHVAKSIDEALTRKWGKAQGEGEDRRGVMLLFLDGEEAFHEWSDTDSLYGARSLAEAWEKTHHPATSTRKNHLSSIDLFLLLDLLGSANPRIPSYFSTTHWAYTHMSTLETQLRSNNHFLSHTSSPGKWFYDPPAKPDRFSGFMVQDDHVPFLARGVEVLHVIPAPFPDVWHTMRDDGEHLDERTVKDWAYLVTAFVVGWVELEGWVEAPLDTAGKIVDGGVGIGVGRREAKTEL